MARRQEIVSVAERLVAADPTLVWSLLANPERISDWAGLRMVGYLGTELPQAGQSVFVEGQGPRAKSRRVEIEAWDAGTGIKCIVHTEPEPTGFELTIYPEVQHGSIATRVRLVQRSHVVGWMAPGVRWWIDRQLERKLDRIEGVAR